MSYDKIIDNYIMDRANFIDVKGMNCIQCESFSNKITYPITVEDAKQVSSTGVLKFSSYLKGIIYLLAIKRKTKYTSKLPIYKSILREFFLVENDFEIMECIYKNYMNTLESDDFNEMVIGRAIYNMGFSEEYFLNKLSKLYFNMANMENDMKIVEALNEANESILKELYEKCSENDKDFYLGKLFHSRGDIENSSNYMRKYVKNTKNKVKVDAAKSYIVSGYMQKAYYAVKQYEETMERHPIDEAIEELRDLLDLNFMKDDIYINIAKLYLKLGDTERAVENLDIALENNKDNIEAIMMRSMIRKLN